MLKKSGALLLTMLYVITAAGFALNFNYCCSRLTSVKINSQVKSCNMPMPGKMKCCESKHLDVKVKDAHQGQSAAFIAKITGFELTKVPFADVFLSARQAVLIQNQAVDPPDISSSGMVTLLKNCMLRI
jgi:hypothetical protein